MCKTESKPNTQHPPKNPKKTSINAKTSKKQKNRTNTTRSKYRGKGQKNVKNATFSVFLVNLRGIVSKMRSLKGILKRTRPSVVIMNETQLSGRMKVVLEGFNCWTKNRTERGGGGVATAVDGKYRDFSLGAGEGEKDDEYLITKIDKFKPALNIINCYGEQRVTKKEEVELKWKRLLKDMNEIKAKNEFCLLAGDLNKLVGCDELGIPGNNPELSPGGKLLRSLLATKEWVLINSLGSEVVEGGPFTREDPATGKLSCLDLFVASRNLLPYVSKLVVDSKRKMAVYRVKRTKNKYKRIYSDHYSNLLTLSNLPLSENKEEKKVIKWNLAKDGGWERYKKLTEKPNKKLDDMIHSKENTIEDITNKMESVLNNVRFKAFGKVTISNKNKEMKQTKKENNSENKSSDSDKIEFTEEERKVDDELKEIEKKVNGKVGKIWEVRKRIVGGKKAMMEATAIINPKTGKLAVTRADIKEVTLNYCKETLANNIPEKGFEEKILEKKDVVKYILSQKDGNFEANSDTFVFMIGKFKRSRKKSYDYLTKAGRSFQNTVFKFCVRMFEEEKFPRKFQNTILHMIYKGVGRKSVLSQNRFIHCKDVWARCAEGLVVEDGLKTPLLEGSSIYQVGGQPGHRSEELVFVFKSVIAKYRMENKLVVVQFYDISKFFDKEMIEDGVLTCLRRGADPKAVRLWYKLNENTHIQAKTGAGMTKVENVGAVIAQGMIGGALVSQAVLDEGMTQNFPPAGNLELEYGKVPLAPIMWMDDFLHASQGLEEARESNKRVFSLLSERGLQLNYEKSVAMVIGSKKQRDAIQAKIEEEPLVCGKYETKFVEDEKWLGQYISARGLADSVDRTVKAREGKINGACQEIAEIVNDWRSRVVGGMESAILLWESCCVPSLLHGSGTWVEIAPQTEKTLNSIQLKFVRLILQVGPGAPLASLLWDFGLLDMGLRIWREKLMMIMHLRSLDVGTLARQTYQTQLDYKWPGLAEEASIICRELEIESCHSSGLDPHKFRKVVTSACHRMNEKRLRKQAEGKEKCDKIMLEPYGKKDYVGKKIIYQVRQHYKTRVKMMPFAGNFTHDRRFSKTEWLCKCRQIKEVEGHLTSGKCPVYGDIRERYTDLKNDDDLVHFFQEVLDRREMLDKEEEAAKIASGLGGGAISTPPV